MALVIASVWPWCQPQYRRPVFQNVIVITGNVGNTGNEVHTGNVCHTGNAGHISFSSNVRHDRHRSH